MSIGGYNELELEYKNSGIHTSCLDFQSARAALYALLYRIKPNKIYIPNYLCDSIIPVIDSLNIRKVFYEVGIDLLPEKIPVFDKNDMFLVINYFGVLSSNIKEIVSTNPSKFIIDNSQALFSPYVENAHSIYSPRKFLPVPDGGYLKTNTMIPAPKETHNSFESLNHLLIRSLGQVEIGYKYFLKSEKILEDFIPKRMSQASNTLIKIKDLDFIKSRRRRNYYFMMKKFHHRNLLELQLDSEDIPLCYPLMLEGDVTDICNHLINDKIFIPRYWNSDYSTGLAERIYNNTLFLPIDERLNEPELFFMYEKVCGLIDE